MKKWILTCSTDAIDIDFEEVIESENEPDFWTCQNMADAHGCGYWYCEELKGE